MYKKVFWLHKLNAIKVIYHCFAISTYFNKYVFLSIISCKSQTRMIPNTPHIAYVRSRALLDFLCESGLIDADKMILSQKIVNLALL